MRVTLLHNRSAGSEDHAEHEIEASMRRAGHEMVDVASNLDELRPLPGGIQPVARFAMFRCPVEGQGFEVVRPPRSHQTVNEEPQPQVVLAFGLRITNCAPCRLSV